MKYVPAVALLVAGVIHLLPVPGVMGASALMPLYGIEVADPNLAILLQHRALLFGMLGVLMLGAIAYRPLRIIAMAMGLFSTASFIAIALWVGGANAAIDRIVAADTVALIFLVAGLAVAFWQARRREP
ncbi:MAG: hypothetical protein JNK21_09020 [Rhodospirillaceae bacterium]|nr:hypothetical protein [Rhodospirillaceae bacterium]